MRTSISSENFYGLLRSDAQSLQQRLSLLQNDVSAGRKSDPGLSLGAAAGSFVRLESHAQALRSYADANAAVSVRLSATGQALDALLSTARQIQQQALAGGDPTSLQTEARSALEQALATLNTSVDGQYLFGGLNSDRAPVSSYLAAGAGAAKAATDSAFAAAFGISQDAPGLSNITSSQMQTFVDGGFSTLFADPSWGNVWSTASDVPTSARIGPDQVVTTSASANATGVRQLLKGLTLLADVGLGRLASGTARVVTSSATATLGVAIKNLTDMSSTLGAALNETQLATDLLSKQATWSETRASQMTDVDMAAASQQITMLETQLQATYSLTARMSKLSLLNYL